MTLRQERQIRLVDRLYLEAIKHGDREAVEFALEHIKVFDKDCLDINGDSAIDLAIEKKNTELLKILIDYKVDARDSLLRAVDTEFIEAVELICEYAEASDNKSILEVSSENGDFHPVITPLVHAAHLNNYHIVKVLLKYGVEISSPSKWEDEENYSLESCISTYELYRALSSPAYISLTAVDPIDQAFKLGKRMKELMYWRVEFGDEFHALAEQCECYAADLLNHIRSSQEQMIVFNYSKEKRNETNITTLSPSRVKLAIDCGQKKFVAHRFCQQFLTETWYRDLWIQRSQSSVKTLLFTITAGFMFPVLSVANIISRDSKLGRWIEIPYIKFICHSTSQLMFFLLILADNYVNANSVNLNTTVTVQHGTMILMFIWVLSLTWSVICEINREHVRWKTLYDFLYLSLFWVYFIIKISTWIQIRGSLPIVPTTTPTPTNSTPGELSWLKDELAELKTICSSTASSSRTVSITKRKFYKTDIEGMDVDIKELDMLYLVAGIVLAFAKVLAVLRMMTLLVWSRHVGPMQISLCRTMIDIGRFMIIFIFVWFAFSLGMNQIYWYYDKAVFGVIGFQSLSDSLSSLFWSLFGVSEPTVFTGHKAYYTITEIAGMGMYSLYHVFAIVVLLNLLIAMMSNTYTNIEQDADIEWKYARSQLWLQYFDDNITVPPPFNLIPRPAVCYNRIKSICKCSCPESAMKKKKTGYSRAKSQFRMHYQKLLSKIGRRYHFDCKEEDNETGEVVLQAVANFRHDMLGALKKVNNNVLDVQKILSNDRNSEPTCEKDSSDLDGDLVRSMRMTTSDSINSVQSGCYEATSAKLPKVCFQLNLGNEEEDEVIIPVRSRKTTEDTETASDNQVFNQSFCVGVEFMDD